MARWLLKSEPGVYGWADLVRDGGTAWDGVRNHSAAIHLKAMRVDDEAFYYHSNDERACVAIARITREAYLDPKDETHRFVAVDVAPVKPLPRPVTLAAIKAEPRLADMVLVRNSRLSVQPVTPAEWDVVLELAAAQD